MTLPSDTIVQVRSITLWHYRRLEPWPAGWLRDVRWMLPARVALNYPGTRAPARPLLVAEVPQETPWDLELRAEFPVVNPLEELRPDADTEKILGKKQMIYQMIRFGAWLDHAGVTAGEVETVAILPQDNAREVIAALEVQAMTRTGTGC